ncbi:FBP domain-containing protein [Schumannella sp. 10F1B-5-1]|uniref:FBP domain-containing protein n=1 Tax=Schumannella sp. 10F1B-5-1 TaxID=2590780 RepID=UPI0011320148|nr:FBP domain-containing protein [Schumannella sp. 10F1B-5-1]TPW71579.1 FBP domain-containing protein [Schumannella sp. 10F1B-5-1]
MHSFDEKALRAAFVNASRKDLSDMTPPDLGVVDFDRLDYLGWRDRKLARRAYLVVPVPELDPSGAPVPDGAERLVGIVLRQAEAAPRARAQCSWCQDVRLPNDVVFFSAKRAGAAGRKGDTVGTLMCSEFECSANVRTPPPPAYLGFDVDAAVRERTGRLRELAANFGRTLLGDEG